MEGMRHGQQGSHQLGKAAQHGQTVGRGHDEEEDARTREELNDSLRGTTDEPT